MPDRHIDYREASEYGRHFIRQAGALAAEAAPLVDIGMLQQIVDVAVRRVEAALGISTSSGSELRGGQEDAAAQTEAVRGVVRRHYHHLQSLPADTGFDLEAFYPGGVLGDISRMKPADVLAHSEQVLRGFNAARNQSLPGAATWRADITAARDALDAALGGKGSSRTGKRTASRELQDARKGFLHVYNHVAKPLIRGVLGHLGRGQDFRQYFLDLQVNEGSSAASPAPADDAPVPSTDA